MVERLGIRPSELRLGCDKAERFKSVRHERAVNSGLGHIYMVLRQESRIAQSAYGVTERGHYRIEDGITKTKITW